MEIIIAMVIAFLLGAYIRQPFVLVNRKLPDEKKFTIKDLDLSVHPFHDEESKAEAEAMLGEKKKSLSRAAQLENMFNYNESMALEKEVNNDET